MAAKVCPVLSKSPSLNPETEAKEKKINMNFARPPGSYQLISCSKHFTTLANAFKCILLYEI